MFLAYFFDEIRITDISLVFLMNFFRSHSHLYIETKTNDFFSLSRRHGLFGGANCKEKERRNKGDFLAPFSTRIQLKKKRTIITTRFFLNAHIKTTKQHLHPIPFLATALYSSKLLFWKIVSTEREEGEEYCFYVLCVCL